MGAQIRGLLRPASGAAGRRQRKYAAIREPLSRGRAAHGGRISAAGGGGRRLAARGWYLRLPQLLVGVVACGRW